MAKRNNDIRIIPLEILQEYDYDYEIDFHITDLIKLKKYNTEHVTYGVEKIILDNWQKYKKVYNLDNTFTNILINTEISSIPVDIIKTIPFPSFYLKLNPDNNLSTIDGILVYIEIIEDRILVLLLIYQKNDCDHFFLNINNYQIINDEIIFENKPSKGVTHFCDDHVDDELLEYCDNDSDAYSKIIMQFIMYISSKKPDIMENPITKKTYKPSKCNKNKFSEIQMWDVGARYGQAIKLALEKADKYAENIINLENESKNNKQRKSPRPHVRRAHYRRARTGKGRTEVTLIWIPPVIVCGDKEIPVTIHDTTVNE